MIWLLLFLNLYVYADTKSQLSFEKTYSRDNTFCEDGKQSVEVLIRGLSKTYEPNDKGYGEFLFLIPKKRKEVIELDINKDRSDSFRFFPGSESACNKTLGKKIDKKTFALLLLKENRPFNDRLVIQFFSLPDFRPLEFLETDFLSNNAEVTNSGFAFNVIAQNPPFQVSQVMIGGQKYLYYVKDFSYWMNYSGKGFKTLKKMSFEKFPWRSFFKNQRQFEQAAGWNSNERIFEHQKVYIAINHDQNKQCIYIAPKEFNDLSKADWTCIKL